ncbi:MAG: pseudouridine-5'-phosphate glycosidase [Clostridiales bacterium]|nr:pseudouridine-5'-phosphate glycosidase [Clostridiales bacterium]
MIGDYLEISQEVKETLQGGGPVVALESTIISHGFDYPENMECAIECEQRIRANGAIPATIAIINGKIKIGLSNPEIEYLATEKIIKCSRRDVAYVLSQGLSGASTVAATMMFADMAGIKVFATGGTGGVHRGAQETFDISADLEELANTNVAVVCAGCKSILDIPLTREYLETAGVPVVGYDTDDFPGFYTRVSGTKVDYNINSIAGLAKMVKAHNDLGLKGGMIIANPIPAQYEVDYGYITEKVEAALKEAEREGIYGKDTTPFLLGKLKSITEGKSVIANKALVYNNSEVAAKIACELSKL